MEAVVDSVDYSAVTDDVEATTDHELWEMFGINTEGKTAAEIMAEVADAEARMQSGMRRGSNDAEAAMRKRLAARKKKLASKMNFFSGKVPIGSQWHLDNSAKMSLAASEAAALYRSFTLPGQVPHLVTLPVLATCNSPLHFTSLCIPLSQTCVLWFILVIAVSRSIWTRCPAN